MFPFQGELGRPGSTGSTGDKGPAVGIKLIAYFGRGTLGQDM